MLMINCLTFPLTCFPERFHTLDVTGFKKVGQKMKKLEKEGNKCLL